MAIFVWNEKYAVGIEKIDQQHKHLIQMIGDLQEALLAQRGQQMLTEIAKRMLDYTEYHFSTEESLLKNNGYTLYAAHKEEHGKFTAKALEIKERVDSKRFVLSLEVINFLRDWLSDHILVHDKRYAPFLIGAGVR